MNQNLGIFVPQRFGDFLSGLVLVIVFGFILGNFGVLPVPSPTYSTVDTLLQPLAIPLLLFQTDIGKFLREVDA